MHGQGEKRYADSALSDGGFGFRPAPGGDRGGVWREDDILKALDSSVLRKRPGKTSSIGSISEPSSPVKLKD